MFNMTSHCAARALHDKYFYSEILNTMFNIYSSVHLGKAKEPCNGNVWLLNANGLTLISLLIVLGSYTTWNCDQHGDET